MYTSARQCSTQTAEHTVYRYIECIGATILFKYLYIILSRRVFVTLYRGYTDVNAARDSVRYNKTHFVSNKTWPVRYNLHYVYSIRTFSAAATRIM